MSEPIGSVSVSHDGIMISFQSDDPLELDAVEECFAYFWTTTPAAMPGQKWTINSRKIENIDDVVAPSMFRTSKGLFKDAQAQKAVVGAQECYSHFVQSTRCVTCFDVSRRAITFYREGPITEHSYIRNLIREPVLAAYKTAGSITLHASSCVIAGRGILMPGVKGAGKSTLLSHLIDGGGKFLANDAVLCERHSEGISIAAFPQCVRLSREIIDNHQRLSDYFGSGGPAKFILEKFEFLPNAFDRIYAEHALCLSASLDLILIPALDISKKGFSLEPVAEGSVRDLLSHSLFYPYHHYVWSPPHEELNDPAIDVINYHHVFEQLPSVLCVRYGILAEAERERLIEAVTTVARPKVPAQ